MCGRRFRAVAVGETLGATSLWAPLPGRGQRIDAQGAHAVPFSGAAALPPRHSCRERLSRERFEGRGHACDASPGPAVSCDLPAPLPFSLVIYRQHLAMRAALYTRDRPLNQNRRP